MRSTHRHTILEGSLFLLQGFQSAHHLLLRPLSLQLGALCFARGCGPHSTRLARSFVLLIDAQPVEIPAGSIHDCLVDNLNRGVWQIFQRESFSGCLRETVVFNGMRLPLLVVKRGCRLWWNFSRHELRRHRM